MPSCLKAAGHCLSLWWPGVFHSMAIPGHNRLTYSCINLNYAYFKANIKAYFEVTVLEVKCIVTHGVEQFKEHLHFVDSAAIERVCSRRALLILSEIGLWRVALLRLASLVRLLLLNLPFFNAVQHTQNVTDRNLVRGYEATNTAGVQVNSILVKGVVVDLFHGRECYDGRWRFGLTQLTNIFVHFILVGVSGLVWTKFAWEWLTKKYLGIWKFVTAFGQECSCDGNSFFYWGLSLGQIVASHLQDNHRGVESWGFDIVEGALYCFVFECDHLGGFILVDFVGLDLHCVGIPNNRQIRIVTVSRAWTGIGCRMWAVNGMRV